MRHNSQFFECSMAKKNDNIAHTQTKLFGTVMELKMNKPTKELSEKTRITTSYAPCAFTTMEIIDVKEM